MKKILIPFLAMLLLAACGQNQNKTQGGASDSTTSPTILPDTSIVQTAKEAYIFGLPLVLMYISRRQAVSANSTSGLHGPVNQFISLSKFPDATFRDVVRPNARNTYYTSARLDLEKEPVILTVPDTKGRYYMMPMLDAYTNVFASPGKEQRARKPAIFL